MDYQALRKRMLQEQLMARGISDQGLISAFLKVERHKFVPPEMKESAYADFPLPIGEGQTISQPYIVALMTQALELSGKERALEIGSGSGYQTAILAELAKEVYTIERIKLLSDRARALLSESGYRNIKFKNSDGALGWPEEGPFERVIVTAATSRIPDPLLSQLKEGGRLILPLGESVSQSLTLVTKIKGKPISQNLCGCVFVPLVTGVA